MRVKFVLTMNNLILQHQGKEVKIDKVIICWVEQDAPDEEVQKFSSGWLFDENFLYTLFPDLIKADQSSLNLIPMDS